MFKIAVLMHMLLATVLAGVAVVVITATPSLYDSGMKLILPAVIGAVLVAILPSIWIAKKILAQTGGA
jgi:flagellar biosynthesis protein FliQ